MKNNNIVSNRIKKIIIKLLFILCFIIFFYCGIKIILWFKDNYNTKKNITETENNVKIVEDKGNNVEEVNPPKEEKVTKEYISDYYYYMSLPFMSVDLGELNKKNSDTVGWIRINGTDINYPVVQTSDNDYYINHAFDKSYNAAGWIFGDYRCNFDSFGRNTIIYGHNRLDNTLFGTLLNVTNPSFGTNKDNRVIQLSTKTKNTLWEIFTVYTVDKNVNYLLTYFEDENMYSKYLEEAKNRSAYNLGVNVDSNDRILTLSTCANDVNYRVVVQAKLIKITDK